MLWVNEGFFYIQVMSELKGRKNILKEAKVIQKRMRKIALGIPKNEEVVKIQFILELKNPTKKLISLIIDEVYRLESIIEESRENKNVKGDCNLYCSEPGYSDGEPNGSIEFTYQVFSQK